MYANGDEIACKAGDNKVIAAFPNVCLSPPSPPAGPIPVPYPDTSFSKDMQSGSKTVKIKGKEVMLKDQSFYKTLPLGDEAATNGLGANVITHVITGTTYCVAWSMDVKFEGKNVDRHTDLTTSNHASPIAGNPTPMITQGAMAASSESSGPADDPCKGVNCENLKKEIAAAEGELASVQRAIRTANTRRGFVIDTREAGYKRQRLLKQIKELKDLQAKCCPG